MRLSNQAMGAIMMALQKSLLEQSDIVPVISSFNFQLNEEEELIVLNPPSFKTSDTSSVTESGEFGEEKNSTVGSD